MANVDALFPGKYLKAADLNGKVVRLKIASVEQGVKLGDDVRPVVHFDGTDRMLVLNKTNTNRIVMTLYATLKDKAKDTDNWTGQSIDLYEEMVEFQGAFKPAIRVRVPGQTAPQQTYNYSEANRNVPAGARPAVTGHLSAPPPASETDYGTILEDEIPF